MGAILGGEARREGEIWDFRMPRVGGCVGSEVLLVSRKWKLPVNMYCAFFLVCMIKKLYIKFSIKCFSQLPRTALPNRIGGLVNYLQE